MQRNFKSSIFIFFLLVIFSIGLFWGERVGLTQSPRGFLENIFNPPKRFLYNLKLDTQSKLGIFTFWRSGVKKIAHLEMRVGELEVTAARVAQLEKENEALRKQLQAPLPPSYQYLPVQVIGILDKMMIDKGSLDGVSQGLPVVFENVFIGQIFKTNPHTSLVLLPNDPDFKLSAKTQNGVEGLLQGEFGTKITFTKVLQKEEIDIGYQVITSGDDKIPPNLLLGKILKLEEVEEKPFKKAEVEPIFDYGSLGMVFLIRQE